MKLYEYQDILTIDEVMDILKIGRGQCYELLNMGLLKGFKLGSKIWKIPRTVLRSSLPPMDTRNRFSINLHIK